MNENSKIYSLPVKMTAVILSFLLLVTGIGTVLAFTWLWGEKVYTREGVWTELALKGFSEEYNAPEFVRFLVEGRYLIIAVGVLSGILFLSLLVYLCTAAGHKRGVTGIKSNVLIDLPFDFMTVSYLFFMAVFMNFPIHRYSGSEILLTGAVSLCFAYFLSLAYLVTFVINVKNGNLFQNMLTVKVVKAIFTLLRGAGDHIGAIGRFLALFFGLLLFEIIFMSLIGGRNPANILIFLHLFIFAAGLYFSVSAKRIEDAGRKIISGDTNEGMDTKGLVGEFKVMGEQLNSIGEGLEAAIRERMKSERFKTELITNVSHDIKTPLTSIINYTDLLQKENIETEPVKTYVEVLYRQSDRLKRLIEDLIEASKASSGSLPVEITEFDIKIMLNQALGEYSDKLAEAGLQAVTGFPEKEVRIKGDSRHLWRVIDNLLNNIKKYGKRGTRVYIDLSETGDLVTVIFKNISETELNISGEELMERFVRGDRARNTEGSGLGLSIAKSMMELMDGSLKIIVDGDLFKVILYFRK